MLLVAFGAITKNILNILTSCGFIRRSKQPVIREMLLNVLSTKKKKNCISTVEM
jgi:hypothetical protein